MPKSESSRAAFLADRLRKELSSIPQGIDLPDSLNIGEVGMAGLRNLGTLASKASRALRGLPSASEYRDRISRLDALSEATKEFKNTAFWADSLLTGSDGKPLPEGKSLLGMSMTTLSRAEKLKKLGL